MGNGEEEEKVESGKRGVGRGEAGEGLSDGLVFWLTAYGFIVLFGFFY